MLELLSTPIVAGAYLELLEFLRFAVALFALVLLIVSFIAYRRTGSRRLLFVSIAFGLFLVKVSVVEHLDYIAGWPSAAIDLLRIAIDLAVLLLFFLAVVRESR